MSRHPGDDRYGEHKGHRQFWAHAQIDGTRLDVVTTLVHALATRWVAEDVADRFSSSVAITTATVVMGGDGTFDLWEEPGRLMCHVARSGAPDPAASQPDPQRLRLVTQSARPGGHEPGSGIVVERSPGRVTLFLAVPFA